MTENQLDSFLQYTDRLTQNAEALWRHGTLSAAAAPVSIPSGAPPSPRPFSGRAESPSVQNSYEVTRAERPPSGPAVVLRNETSYTPTVMRSMGITAKPDMVNAAVDASPSLQATRAFSCQVGECRLWSSTKDNSIQTDGDLKRISSVDSRNVGVQCVSSDVIEETPIATPLLSSSLALPLDAVNQLTASCFHFLAICSREELRVNSAASCLEQKLKRLNRSTELLATSCVRRAKVTSAAVLELEAELLAVKQCNEAQATLLDALRSKGRDTESENEVLRHKLEEARDALANERLERETFQRELQDSHAKLDTAETRVSRLEKELRQFHEELQKRDALLKKYETEREEKNRLTLFSRSAQTDPWNAVQQASAATTAQTEGSERYDLALKYQTERADAIVLQAIRAECLELLRQYPPY